MPNRLTDLEINEVSFVDRPAAPESRIELFKRDAAEDSEEFYIDKSLPTSEDVMEEEILGSKERKKRKTEEEEDDLEKSASDSSGSGANKEARMADPDLDFTPEQEEYVRSLEDKVIDVEGELEKALDANAELQKSDDSSDDGEDILKSADPAVVELVKAAQAEAQAATEIAKAEREARIRRETLTKAEGYSALPVETDDLANVLYEAGEAMSSENLAKLHEALAGANEAVAVSKLYDELGDPGEGSSAVEDEITKRATEIRKNDPTLTEEQAYDKVITDDPTLYDKTLEGGN